MKDYYKILGIKATASGEDIRNRWIELMRKFHSDGRRKDEAEDRRLKEINEAYGGLKHASRRVEYDLKRTYNRKKRNSYLRRMILPPTILIIFLIIGLIYLRKPRVAILPESTNPSVQGSIAIKVNPPLNEINHMNQTNEIDEINQTNQIVAQPKPPPFIAKPQARSPAVKVISQRSTADTNMKPKGMNNPNVHKDPTHSKTSRLKVKAESPSSTGKTDAQTSQISNPHDLRNANVLKNHDADRDLNDRSISVAHVLIAPNTSIEVEGQIAQLKPPSLIATEDEVKEFLTCYIDRYAQKDVEGFLSLFFSKAVQNGKYGFNEIKKIYSDFFEQSHTLRYHMEDTRIGIYQNAVHIKARYKVDQILEKERKKKVWKGDIRWILVRENEVLKIRYLDYKQQNPHNGSIKGPVRPQSITYAKDRR